MSATTLVSSLWTSLSTLTWRSAASLASSSPSAAAAVVSRPALFSGASSAASRIILPAILTDLLPGFLMAVPKSRTTHGKKRMRMSNKGLKNREDIVPCPVCHGPKLLHHVCPGCLAKLERKRPEVLSKKPVESS
ncbi:hypothetical protein BCR44DRAFT_39754 [Catenaria anguillulae PL171]|uniref:Large ribosomal subunit protein bL32m n=1 Tax=Catenaria anguillulae PL171 TaxID=765915 RepID=A0A1Y2HQN8_9FUNG|nr:hypothetical protein BCR44DRAFT_39754 [Catenaria anguillulae PL171]